MDDTKSMHDHEQSSVIEKNQVGNDVKSRNGQPSDIDLENSTTPHATCKGDHAFEGLSNALNNNSTAMDEEYNVIYVVVCIKPNKM